MLAWSLMVAMASCAWRSSLSAKVVHMATVTGMRFGRARVAAAPTGQPECSGQLRVSHCSVVHVFTDKAKLPEMRYHPVVRPHVIRDFVFVPNVLADMLHTVDKVAIPVAFVCSNERDMVTEPTNQSTRESISQVMNPMMLDP